MRNGHGTGADGHNGQRCLGGAVQAHGTQQRRHDTGGGGDGNGGGALCGLQNRGQQEGEEDTNGAQNGGVGGDVVDHVAGGDDLAQNAACGGDEQDGAGDLQGVVGQLIEVCHLTGGSQLNDGADGAHSQSDDGLAQEVEQVEGEAGPTGHGGDGAQSHQDNGNHDGGQSVEAAGQLAVAGNQLFIGLDGFLGRAGFIRALDLLANVLGEEQAGNQRQDGGQDTKAHHQQQIVADAQGIGGGDGAGGRRNEYVGDIQTGGQRNGHGHAGGAGAADHCLPDGIQNNKAAVAEDGDGNDPAHELNGQLGVLLTNQLYHHVGQLQGSAGLLQDGADQGAQDDDDADGAEGSGEACADDSGNITQGDTRQKGQDQGNAHDGQEGMDLVLGDCYDHYYNCQNKCNN